MYRRIIIVLLIPFFYFFSENRTDGFRNAKVILKKPLEYKIDQKEDISKIKKILQNKFYYLDRGRQSFVFESEDGKYVIKLINFNNVKYPKFLRFFDFFNILKKSLDRKDRRYPLTFKSMIISYEKLKKECALVYAHIGKRENLNKEIILVSKYGQDFFLDVDSSCFVIQKKMKPIYPVLKKIYKKGDIQFKKALDDIVDIFLSRAEKGIFDDDLNIEKNFGFYKNKPKIMDAGKLFFYDIKNKEDIKNEMNRSLKFFKKWIFKNYPKYSIYIEESVNKKINSLTF